MNILEVSGAAFLFLIGVGTGWLLYQLAKDAIVCARFTYRVVRISTRQRNLPHFCWEVFVFWLRTWIGLNSRPDRMRNTLTGRTAYWPGRERAYDEEFQG